MLVFTHTHDIHTQAHIPLFWRYISGPSVAWCGLKQCFNTVKFIRNMYHRYTHKT